MSLYYQPSNKMPLGGALLFLLVGTAAAGLLVLVYVYAVWYIPFVYINFFICVGFGFVLGAVLMTLVRLGKLRNPRAVAGLGLLVGLAAVYLEWGVFLTLLFNAKAEGTGRDADTSTSFSTGLFADIVSHPRAMWEAMLHINATGTWSLKGSTATGWFLWVIWGIEVLIIVGSACLLARSQATDPFSESTNQWADEEALAHPVCFAADADATRKALETGQFNTLMPHPIESAEASFARLKLHCVPNDTTCQYLTLENVTTTVDDKGKAKETTATVVQHLTISAATCQDLKARFGMVPVAAEPA